MTKPKLYGAVWDTQFMADSHPMYVRHEDGSMSYARPVPYYSLLERLQMAWHVLTYKADALYWEIDFND